MDDRMFRNAMGKFTTGVTVITAKWQDEIYGMTANAFMSVSMNPKLISVSIDEKANMHDKMGQVSRFAVSILSDQQRDISMHFARQKEKDKVAFEWFHGVPVIKDAIAAIVCDVYDSYKAGDHTLFIGKVINLETKQGNPLVFFEGKYGTDHLNKNETV
ncbi:MAG TPA: flavin reductase family protein [Bacillales bacterium]|nr:flavin reductase family protein [Bacillales bacterium]